jgi:hypothetical protein
VHTLPESGRRHYGTDTAPERHNDRGDPSSDTDSQESLRTPSRRHGINPKTVAKWRSAVQRQIIGLVQPFPSQPSCPSGRRPSSLRFASTRCCRSMTVCTPGKPTIPQLTRSSLHRCLERHRISRLPEVEGDKPRKKKFDSYPIGFFYRSGRSENGRRQALPLRGHRPNLEVRCGRTR